MKFTIFKWWESWIKLFIYALILIATAGLITGYYFIKDDGGMIAFVVSILYALVLFIVNIPINKIDRYTSEKIYERERFYLTLERLRDVTNSTIQKADENDLTELITHIIAFQVFTGRTENMIEQRLQGKKVPVYIKEKGFTYSSKMQELEMVILKLHKNNGNEKKVSKCSKKLCKCYNKSCKRLDRNYNRIARIYGGALFDLIERDSTASDTEYLLGDIGAKVDEIHSEICSLMSELKEVESNLSGNQRDLLNNYSELAGKVADMESIL